MKAFQDAIPPKTFYVAGKFADYRRVRLVIDLLSAHGYSCTFDWTRTDEFDAAGEPKAPPGSKGELTREELAGYAIQDIMGVESADFLVLLADCDLCGAWVEFGVALAAERPRTIYVLSSARWTIFLEHEKVVQMGLLEFLLDLKDLDP